jgi:hypothetical protein
MMGPSRTINKILHVYLNMNVPQNQRLGQDCEYNGVFFHCLWRIVSGDRGQKMFLAAMHSLLKEQYLVGM